MNTASDDVHGAGNAALDSSALEPDAVPALRAAEAPGFQMPSGSLVGEPGVEATAVHPAEGSGDVTPPEAGTPSGYSLWRDRRYLTWLASDTSLGLGGAVANFAIPLIALAATGSPVQAGLIGSVSMIVRLISTLIGGVMADRFNRLSLMVLGCLVGIVFAILFAGLAAMDVLTFVVLLAFSMAWQLRGGLFYVAGEAVIKDVVPDESMGRAQAANQARDAAIGIAGGPLGGVLLAVGAWLVAAVMAACQLVALITAMILRRGERAESGAASASPTSRNEADADAPGGGSPSAWADAKEGVVWLFRRADLRGVLVVATLINLGFNAGMTTVVFSLQLGGHSPQVIGGLAASVSAVMLVGAVLAPMVVSRVKAGTLVLLGLTLASAGMLSLVFVQGVGAIIAVLAAGVLLIPGLNAGLIGYQMVATPRRLLGRVNSALGVTSMAAMPLAPIIAGFGLEWVGRTGTLLVAGGICVVATLLTLASPSLRALPKESGWKAHAARFGSNGS